MYNFENKSPLNTYNKAVCFKARHERKFELFDIIQKEKAFAGKVWALLEKCNLAECNAFCLKTTLSRHVFYDLKNRVKRDYSLETIVILCAALNVDTDLATELLAAAGKTFILGDREHEAFKAVLNDMQDRSLYEKEVFLNELGIQLFKDE